MQEVRLGQAGHWEWGTLFSVNYENQLLQILPSVSQHFQLANYLKQRDNVLTELI